MRAREPPPAHRAVALRAMRTGTDGRLFVDVVHGNERNRGTVAGARALSAEICAQCGCAGDPVESPDGSRTTLCAGCRSQAHTPLARDWPVEATPDHPHAISPGQWTQDLRGPGVGVEWDAEDWRNYGKLETLYAEPIARLMRADDDAAAMRLWAGGPGWAPLVRALFTALRPEQEERPGEPGHTPWRLRWMKEKFGTLRVRTCRTTEYQLGVQFVIELQSHKTCMRCSAPGGVTSDGGWYVTLCDGCRKDRARKRTPTPEEAGQLNGKDGTRQPQWHPQRGWAVPVPATTPRAYVGGDAALNLPKLPHDADGGDWHAWGTWWSHVPENADGTGLEPELWGPDGDTAGAPGLAGAARRSCSDGAHRAPERREHRADLRRHRRADRARPRMGRTDARVRPARPARDVAVAKRRRRRTRPRAGARGGGADRRCGAACALAGVAARRPRGRRPVLRNRPGSAQAAPAPAADQNRDRRTVKPWCRHRDGSRRPPATRRLGRGGPQAYRPTETRSNGWPETPARSSGQPPNSCNRR